MTEDQFDYLNDVRNRLKLLHNLRLPSTCSRAELVHLLRSCAMTEDAERVSGLPDFRVFGDKVEGMSVPGGVIGWLAPDGTCTRKTG